MNSLSKGKFWRESFKATSHLPTDGTSLGFWEDSKFLKIHKEWEELILSQDRTRIKCWGVAFSPHFNFGTMKTRVQNSLFCLFTFFSLLKFVFSAFSALSYGDSVNEEAVKWPERTQIMEEARARSWFLNSWACVSSHFSVRMLRYSWLMHGIDVDPKAALSVTPKRIWEAQGNIQPMDTSQINSQNKPVVYWWLIHKNLPPFVFLPKLLHGSQNCIQGSWHPLHIWSLLPGRLKVFLHKPLKLPTVSMGL